MTASAQPKSSPIQILVVCTGNICRSPIAEQVLRERLTSAGVPVIVQSAGTEAMAGHGMTPEAAEQAQRFGATTNDHRAQQLTAQLLADADLVLTATRAHRADVVSLHPRASRYTYTLNQFARLLAQLPKAKEELPPVEDVPLVEERPTKEDASRNLPNENFTTLLTEIAASRGETSPLANPADDDIGDPYRQPPEAYNRAGGEIDRATATIASVLSTRLGTK